MSNSKIYNVLRSLGFNEEQCQRLVEDSERRCIVLVNSTIQNLYAPAEYKVIMKNSRINKIQTEESTSFLLFNSTVNHIEIQPGEMVPASAREPDRVEVPASETERVLTYLNRLGTQTRRRAWSL